MKKRPPSLGIYILCGEQPEDAIILVDEAASHLLKIFKRGSLEAKPVAPGMNIEKASGRTAGIRLYPKANGRDSTQYRGIGARELEFLHRLTDRLVPTVAVLKRRVAWLARSRNGKR